MRRGEDSGLSLIELVVVMAVFALVAVMSLQTMSGTIRLRDRLGRLETRSAEMTRAMTLLRADLDAMVPMPFHPPDGSSISSFVAPVSSVGQTRSLSFSAAGQPVFPGSEALQFARIIWSWDPTTQTLHRQRWPLLSPLSQASREPQEDLLSGVSGFDVRSHAAALPAGQDWISGDGQSENSVQTDLPAAVEILITTTDFGPLRLLVSLQ
ncbi:MAG: type II secretion system protein GspJ [Pseudoruegeria sp.]